MCFYWSRQTQNCTTQNCISKCLMLFSWYKINKLIRFCFVCSVIDEQYEFIMWEEQKCDNLALVTFKLF